MRIALVSDCYLPRLGGIELQVHDLAVQLGRAGHRVTVFTTTAGPPVAGEVAVVRLGSSATGALRAALAPFDVVHAHTSLVSPLAWRAARVAVAPILTMHSLPSPGLPWPLARLDRYVGQVQWTAVSQVVADLLRRSLPGRPVGVLHNGVDPDRWRHPGLHLADCSFVPFASAADAGPDRRPGGAGEKGTNQRWERRGLTIVSTMRLARRKRPLPLLRTLQRIRELVPAGVDLRAVVVGAGPQARAVAAQARRSGLAEWVELPGRLTRGDLQRLYAAADIYLAPAELESFGVAALEARCAGLPVIAMASGGVGEFVRPGIEGYLVANDHQMAQATAALLTNPTLLTRIQDHNRHTDPLMTWNHVIAQHLAAYRTQLSRSTSPLALTS